MKVTDISHSLKHRPGGQIPEMIQVWDYDILIVLGELNTLILVGPLNNLEIGQNMELGHFEVGNFRKKNLFSHNWGVLEHRSRA